MHIHKYWKQTRTYPSNTLTMVLNACCSCCCMSRPQATHSSWQSLRPGVKRHASSTTRYHRGIFIAQHGQTKEQQTGAQPLGENFLEGGPPTGETGRGETTPTGVRAAACREKADNDAYCVNTDSQGPLAGFGRSVKALVSRTSSAKWRGWACVGWRESTTGGKRARGSGQGTAAAGRPEDGSITYSSIFGMNYSERITHFSTCHQKKKNLLQIPVAGLLCLTSTPWPHLSATHHNFTQ